MEVLKDMFPAMSDNALQIALTECGDNLEAAIDYCLNMETINSLPSQPQQSQQQQQQAPQQQLSQMEMDEMLARELSNSFANYSPPRARRQPVADHSVGLSEVDPAVMAEMLKGMATSMIPLLRDQLQSLQIPAVNEQLDAGKLGTVVVTLDEIRVGNTNVPEEGIDIKSEGNNEVVIKVKDVSASLQQFKWGYEKLSFPKMKDNGNADASILETTIDIKLRIGGDEFGNPNIAVTHCKVNIGKLDLKISGSFASFVYNTLMGIFKKTIKATLETNFEEMIISSVGDGSTNMF